MERGKHTMIWMESLRTRKSEMEEVHDSKVVHRLALGRGGLEEDVQSLQDGLSSNAGTSLALETPGAWFQESAAGVTPFDTSTAFRGHSGGSYQPLLLPSHLPTTCLCPALTGKSSWSCEPDTSNYSPNSSSSCGPAEKSCSWSHRCAMCP